MFKNKKGFVVEFLADIYVFIIFLLLMLIFTALFYIGGKTVKAEIKGEYENLEGGTILLNYLRTPVLVDFDGEEIETDMADLIVKYYLMQYTENEGKLQSLLKEKTEEVFNEQFPHLEWRLIISDKGEEYGFAKTISGQTTSKLTEQITLVDGIVFICTTMPNPELKGQIKIELDFLNLDADGITRSKYRQLRKGEFNC